ncbi:MULTISPECIES: enoyl-CoA hydratase/isomerase family protein [Pseudofrankia]|uniref:enoyl-CoA hydratase/isomerase family protein n=1 Tax=Pseudofrankia TaxID=2994363 RepID=UPI0007C4A45D|nr:MULTISPECIES: enoyl-CoA hydratase-related protein [Pseudofrankia]OHV41589.1 hypothetical protein BCD49_01230 [Pseudofrankia sp. EUN1h]
MPETTAAPRAADEPESRAAESGAAEFRAAESEPTESALAEPELAEPVSAAASEAAAPTTPGDVLLTSTTGRVRLLTLNRPRQANAFSSALYLAAAEALRAAAADDGIGAVVLTGAGKYFSAGTDLVEMAAQASAVAAGNAATAANGRATETAATDTDTADTAQTAQTAGTTGGGPFNAFLDALTTFPKPLLAAVNGAGVGLGLTMLAHCDIVFISEEARLLAPFTTMGVAPEAGSSYLLPRRMGRQRAARALLAAEWISAAEAVETGLALRACPAGTLLAETLALAATIADKPLASVLATTRLIRDAERAGIERARQVEGIAFRELMRRPDLGTTILDRLGPSARDERRS